MPREHVEFIQAQNLPWLPMDEHSARPGAAHRVFSRDPESKATSGLIHYPENWRLPTPHALACDEEFYVLQGTLSIGGREYRAGDYAYLPAAYPRSSMHSSPGAVVLTFFEGEATTWLGGAAENRAPSPDLIEHLSTAAQAWGSATEPVVAGPRVGRKTLRPETACGERSWILSMTGSVEEPIEVNGVEQHPCVEEMFLLAGSFHMPSGVMYAGAYFWRPPMIHHGPMGSRENFVALFRAKEGAFSTLWSQRGAPVPWDRPYRPILPSGHGPVSESPPDDVSRAW